MFDINEIGPRDVVILNGLLPIAQKAIEAEQLIKETYLFRIGEDSIEVWHDEYNHEYLTQDGIWQARYLHQTYDVKCSAEIIFDYFKAEYLIKNGYAKEFEGSYSTEEGNKAKICSYFNSFLRKTANLRKKQLSNSER